MIKDSGMDSGVSPIMGACRILVEQSPISTWVADRNGTNIYENAACRRLFGVDDDVQTVDRYNILQDNILEEQGFMPQVRKVFEEGGCTEFIADYDFSKVRHVHVDHATHRILRMFLFALTGASGEVENVVVQHEDYTERTLAERALRRSEENYRSLFENNPQPMMVYDAQTLAFLAINDAAIAHYGYSCDEFLSMTIKDIRPPEDIPRLLQFLKEQGPGFRTVGAWRHRKRDGSIIYVEIARHTISFGGREAVLVAINDITERLRTEEALKESEERYRRIVETAQEGIWLVDPELRTLYANRRLSEMLGYKEEEILGHSPLEFLDEEAREIALEIVHMPPEKRPTHLDFHFRRKDGSTLWAIVASTLVYGGQGKLLGVLAMLTDITARKRTEEELRRAEERLRGVLQAIPDLMVELDSKGIITNYFASDPHLLDMPPEQFMGRQIRGLIPPDSADRLFSAMAEATRTGHVQVFEDSYVAPQGQTRPFEIRVSPTCFGDFLVIVRDIREQKRMLEALRQSEDRLARIIDTTPSGILICDRKGSFAFANAAAERILGVPRDGILGRMYSDPRWRLTSPGGRAIPDSRLPVALVLRSGEAVFGSELAVERADGSRVILSINAAPLRDDHGKTVGVVTSMTDITERKLAEERKRELEAHKREFYRRTILAATEGKLIISERTEIDRLAGSAIRTWQIEGSETLGRIRHEALEIAERLGMDESRRYDLALCIGESTTNALKHAGGGTASIHRVDNALMFIVADRGHGIEALILPEATLRRGYSTARSMGMGYKAIISIADHVYLATGPAGTTVGIEMRLRAPEEPKSILSIGNLPDTW